MNSFQLLKRLAFILHSLNNSNIFINQNDI